MNIIMNIIVMQYAIIHDITEFLLNIRTLNINYITYFCKKQGSFLPVRSQFFLILGIIFIFLEE